MFRRSCFLVCFLLAATISFAAQIEILLPGMLEFSNPLAYGTVTSYAAGTNTHKNIYTSSALTTSYDNPAQLNASGRLVAYGDGKYKFLFKNASGTTVFTVDNYQVGIPADAFDSADPFGNTLTQTNIVATDIKVDQIEVEDLVIVDSLVFDTGVLVLQNLTSAVASLTSAYIYTLTGHTVNYAVVNASTTYSHHAVINNLQATASGHLDMAGIYRINRLATGTASTDAINLGQLQQTGFARKQVFAGDGTFVVPPGITTIHASGVAGGGGGGGSGHDGASHGSGGKAGTYAYPTPITVVPGETLTITIGLGGAQGSDGGSGASGTAGITGGVTKIERGVTVLLTVAGGLGGAFGGAAEPANAELVSAMGQGSAFGGGGFARDFSQNNIPNGRGAGGGGGYKPTDYGAAAVTLVGGGGGSGLLILEW